MAAPNSGRKEPPRAYSHPFLDPNTFYPPALITDPAIAHAVDAASFAPLPLWQDVAAPGALVPGLLVEFRHEAEIRFGVVVREARARFNCFHNRMVVLTGDNELVHVHAQDVTLAYCLVWAPGALRLGEILALRFLPTFHHRVAAVTWLHQYVALARAFLGQWEPHLRQVYASLASDDGAVATSLPELARLCSELRPLACPTRLHQCAALTAVHLAICADPARWVVPACTAALPLALGQATPHSSALPRLDPKLAVPAHVMADVATFLAWGPLQLAALGESLKELAAGPPDPVQAAVHFINAPEQAPGVRAAFYAAAYPHPLLMAQLALVGRAAGSVLACGADVWRLLAQTGLSTDTSDPLLSSGLLGGLKPLCLLASTLADLSPLRVAQAAQHNTRDNFAHLRRRRYYHDHVIYVLPGGQVGVSMEHINARKYLINVHVPDVAASVLPSSPMFAAWAALAQCPDQSPFPAELGTFRATPPGADFHSVGDGITPQAPEHQQTCTTFLFEYNPSKTNPLKELEHVQVTFDAPTSRFMAFDEKLLEASLTGKLEPGLLGRLRLFNQPAPEPRLSSTDHFNINFIYNVLRRHSEARSRRWAVSVAPTKTDAALCPEASFENGAFLAREARLFAGHIAAQYAVQHQIPALFRSQALSSAPETGSVADEVFITHDNALLPNYSASSYAQAAFARDVSGHLLASAYTFACNFLDPERLATEPGPHLALGLAKGYLEVLAHSMECYLNQLQLLAHVHFVAGGTTGLFEKAPLNAALKGLGYSVHGAMPRDRLATLLERTANVAHGTRFLNEARRRFWVARHVDAHRAEFQSLRCAVTRVSADIEFDRSPEDPLPHTVQAYCERMGLEVRLELPLALHVPVGTEVIAAGVLHVDPLAGEIVVG